MIDLVCILLSLTSCLLIPVWVHLESTSDSICSSLLFFILRFAYILSSFSLLLLWWGIIYWFYFLDILVLCTIFTWDLLQNPSACLLLWYLYPYLLEHFASSFSALFYNPWQYALFIHYHKWATHWLWCVNLMMFQRFSIRK